jgi:hypothetical protein
MVLVETKVRSKTAVHQTVQAHRKWIEQALQDVAPTDEDENLR